MKYIKMKKVFFLLIAAAGMQGCSKFLDKQPFSSLTPNQVFQNASDMALYVNSFYVDQIPSATDIATGDNLSDYISGNNIPALMLPSTNPNNTDGWTWTKLRNINYFLDNYNNSTTIDAATRNSYAGIARYFRALFYFNMVKRYGNVPWYSHALEVTNPELYKPRDPRTLVMDSIVADLDFAIANVPAAKDNGCSTITKWVALALKSRVCLFEGTFRKHHTELSLMSSANDFLNKSLDASTQIINSGNYKLHTTGKPAADYRALFTTETPWSDEMILAAVYSNSLKLWSNLNQYFTSPTLGNRSSLNKQFVDTYLNQDGSRFTDQPSFDTISFVNEMKNRDLRLQQTIRCNGYKRLDGSSSPPDYAYTFTGYHLMKYTLDDKNLDYKSQNNNSIAIFRYAEILLNYAEAKAELHTFTPADWDATIRPLRERAGITDASMPVTADTYLQQHYYPNISDAVLLEIRRERGIELVMEGFRYDDLKRWNAGKLFEMEYKGLYVPAMDVLYDLNEDGKPDVSFVTSIPGSKVPGVYYFLVDNKQAKLTEGDKGNLVWLINIERKYEDFKYYYPLPFNEIVLNPNLAQNPGWQ